MTCVMARLLLMTDFSESYANKLLKGIMRFSHEHEPWVVCKMPLSLRDNGRMDEVVKFAVDWKADAIIGQFLPTDDVDAFSRHGIIVIAQDYQQKFQTISNISGDYVASGRICADYLIKKRVHNFAFFGLKGMVWSDERRDGFFSEIGKRVPDATMSVYEKSDISETWWYDLASLSQWLRELPKPVGILACDDNRAYYIVEASKQGGEEGMRIPEDIMVLGIDNDESLCQLCSPQLSSLNQDTEEAGYDTASLIDELLALPVSERLKKKRDILVEPTFITTRRSTDAVLHPNPFISRILYHINSNINDHISVDDLVSLVPMSRRLLESTFRREMGTSIYQYVIQMRVEKMKDLIINGNSPVAAADLLGVDYKIIARSFKKLTGITPGEFAKSINKRYDEEINDSRPDGRGGPVVVRKRRQGSSPDHHNL